MIGSHRSSVQKGIPLKRNDATYVYLEWCFFDMLQLRCHLCLERGHG